jgi:Cytochrome P450
MRQLGAYGSLSNLSICLPPLSTAVVWALYALGSYPAVHAKLNAEARAFYTDAPTMDELNGMTYLDYVTREVLRLHTPVTGTDRVAKEDTAVPLSEPFIDRHGVKRHEFRQVFSS